jgi:hypothetical protein
MLAFIASALIALLSGSAAASSHATAFPSQGVVVPGQSIGGVGIGMTELQVKQRWGGGYTVCTQCGPELTWLYEYQGGEPLGAAVKFNIPSTPTKTASKSGGTSKSAKTATTSTTSVAPTNGTVVAVFTLGSPLNWGVKGKVMMFDPVSNVYSLFGNPADAQCLGYSALTVRVGSNTMSFYTSSGVIYGFALTAPSQPACQ